MKIITVLSALSSLLAGTAVGQAVPVDAFYCPLKPDLLGACCEKYVEVETAGHYCSSIIFRFREEYLTFTGHEALELYSLVTNTTSQWVCQSENPAVVYTDLCCINPVSLSVLDVP
jgi:hypothetical protein